MDVSKGLGRLASPNVEVERLRALIEELTSGRDSVQEQAQRVDAMFRGFMEDLKRVGSGMPAGGPDGERFADKLKRPGTLTRKEAAAVLGLSSRQLQRMEGRGTLTRCPNTGAAVRYPTSDVLKLASAKPWKED